MKNWMFYRILLLSLGMALLFTQCSKKEDYSNLVYKNYLTYEINQAEGMLQTTEEGPGEGEYNAGSKQAYQVEIDNAQRADDADDASQQEVDDSYTALLLAGEEYFDQMVPFRSDFQIWIDYADFILTTTEEGNQEGNAASGSKAPLEEAVVEANQLIESEDLTQRELDEATTELTSSIYLFNGEINGKAHISLVNAGFEIPGYDTEDFNEVDGWSLFGNVEDWAPLASVVSNESAPEGSFVAKIGSYTQGSYQNSSELINPSSEYTLNFRVSLQSNGTDWEGKSFPAILLTRLIVFEQEEGDYNFVTVLSESYDTLGIEPGNFIELNQTVSIDAISTSIGKEVAFDFIQRHTWDAANPIWAESFVALDDIKLFRQ